MGIYQAERKEWTGLQDRERFVLRPLLLQVLSTFVFFSSLCQFPWFYCSLKLRCRVSPFTLLDIGWYNLVKPAFKVDIIIYTVLLPRLVPILALHPIGSDCVCCGCGIDFLFFNQQHRLMGRPVPGPPTFSERECAGRMWLIMATWLVNICHPGQQLSQTKNQTWHGSTDGIWQGWGVSHLLYVMMSFSSSTWQGSGQNLNSTKLQMIQMLSL